MDKILGICSRCIMENFELIKSNTFIRIVRIYIFVTSGRFFAILEGIERPIMLYCDNKSVVLYSNNNRSSTKSKYIDIKFLTVRERVQSEQISIEYLGTNSMIVDSLTKGLLPKVFHEHVAHMGVLQFKESLV